MSNLLVTLGPASFHEPVIREMAGLGVQLFRINLSHTALEDLPRLIDRIQRACDVPICLDSEGAQLRNQKMENDGVGFAAGATVKIHYEPVLGDAGNISFAPPGIARQLEPGDIVRIDFNLAALQVVEKNGHYSVAKVVAPGLVGSNKAADVNRELPLEPITAKDRAAFEIGKKAGVTNYSLSFAGSSRDVAQCRELVGDGAQIISKIESRQGLRNLKDILAVSDGILIDRGDLSRQVPIEKIPFLQMRIISLARIHDTPVYVATNLLETMLERQTPNRAEMNDVISTLLMGANGLVLAAETAIGRYPVEAVKVARRAFELCRRWTPNSNIQEILEM